MMAGAYGVLRGRPDRWVREDNDASSPHLQVRLLDTTGQPWRIAVNVQSDTGSEVVYWIVDPLVGHPILPGLAGRPQGFSAAGSTSGSALDFVRAPLFDWAKGTALPASGSASADDLQDLLILHLQHCQQAGGEVFAFGVKFDRNMHKPIDAEFGNLDGLHGIHDIHLNQGNKGAHKQDNGSYQDGGLVLAYPDRNVGVFLAFQTQLVPTDAAGNPVADARSIGELISGKDPPPPAGSSGSVYLERALLNPTGDDAGHEVVVIGNLANAPVDLAGFQLVDRNGRHTVLTALTVAAGASALVRLDGSGAQLSNKGGNLVLADPSGKQIDAVVYTSADASPEDRFVRFRR